MLFCKDLINTEKEESSEKEDNKELTEQDYIQINKDISQALFEMKKEKGTEKEDNSNDNSENNEKEIANFDMDFFSESSNSNSFTLDNNSDLSDNSFKSANVEMNRKNLALNDNDNSSSKNDSQANNKVLSLKSKNSTNDSMEGPINLGKKKLYNKKNSFKSTNNKRRSIGFFSNGNNLNNSFNSSPYLNYNNNYNNYFKNLCQINPNFINNNIAYNNNVNNLNINTNNNLNNININSNHINKDLGFNEKMQIIINNNMNNINNINFINKNNEYNFYMQNANMNNSCINKGNFGNGINSNNNNSLSNNMNIINCNNSNICNNNNININNINHNYNIMKMNPNNTITNINNQNIFNLSNSDNSSLNNKIENVDSPKNIIHIENILKSKDKRTTLIIRNIPNRYTISLLLQELNQNYYRKYDVVYLPQDYINNSNLGFGFINFVEHMYLIMFYEEFTGKKWNCFNSNKRCQLAYSKYQGKNELIKYIHKKLGINNHYNNDENLKKSFFINNGDKYPKPSIEIPVKYYKSFISYYPFSLCHIKDDKVFVVDKYHNF